MIVCANRRVPGFILSARRFMLITLEAGTGFANIVVKPHFVQKCRKAIIYSKGLIVNGPVENHNGVFNLIARELTPLRISKTYIAVRSRDFR